MALPRATKTTPPIIPGGDAGPGLGMPGWGRGGGHQSWRARSERRVLGGWLFIWRQGRSSPKGGYDDLEGVWGRGEKRGGTVSRKSPLQLTLPSCGATRRRRGDSPRKSRDVSQNGKIWGLQVHSAWGGERKKDEMAVEAGVGERGKGCRGLCMLGLAHREVVSRERVRMSKVKG